MSFGGWTRIRCETVRIGTPEARSGVGEENSIDCRGPFANLPRNEARPFELRQCFLHSSVAKGRPTTKSGDRWPTPLVLTLAIDHVGKGKEHDLLGSWDA